MENVPKVAKKRYLFLKIVSVITVIAIIAGIFVYNNYNRLLSEALVKNFNSSAVSDVYELKFDDLNVNFLLGDITVYNVEFQPRKKKLRNYPYINSSFKLHTDKLLLKNVEIFTLLKSNILKLDQVEIRKPNVDLLITSKNPIFFPFKDTTVHKDKKKLESFSLKEFELVDAELHVANSAKKRDFRVKKVSLSLLGMVISQYPGKEAISYRKIDFSIGEAVGKIQKESIRYASFKNYKLVIDSLKIQKSVDTMIYHFADFKTAIKDLEIHTADSIFHLSVSSFNLSYKNKTIQLEEVSFKPNISKAAIQKRSQYQTTQFAATVGLLSLNKVDFDGLIYHGKIFIDQVQADRVKAEIFKDNTKPIDKNRIPVYFGEQIGNIKMPLSIREVKATRVNLVNTERKPDGGYGIANINRGTVVVQNITNQHKGSMLLMKADAYLENKAHAVLSLGFSYQKPEFSINGRVDSFKFQDINHLLQSYVPAKINKGTADQIAFSGMVYKSYSTGTMKFLYHDLEVDLKLKDKKKWQNSVITFAANAAIPSANPSLASHPPRVVKFHAERNMNKGFFNIIIKSLLSGLKETLIMSKENKQANKLVKKEAAKKNKKGFKIF